jgi:ATP-dependent Clp protease ATP-binding subunit ClpC
MLQVLEDGILTDSQGRRVDFKNTIIIMTSNVGAGVTGGSRTLGFATASDASESEKKQNEERAMTALKQTFRPEFLNRIDDIILFTKLTESDISEIAHIMLTDVKARIGEIGVDICFDDSVVELVSKEGFDPVYGARPLRRAIVRMVEDTISTDMLEGKIQKGVTVCATAKDGKIVFKKQ